MHELSIALALLEVAQEEAAAHGALRVAAIHLKVGPLSGVWPEALSGAFELAREGAGPAFADCRLAVEETGVTGRCGQCGATRSAVSIQDLRCSVCGVPLPEIVSGRELEITAMEIEP